MRERTSAEAWLRARDKIVADYRRAVCKVAQLPDAATKAALLRQGAIDALRLLGLSQGEAERALAAKPKPFR